MTTRPGPDPRAVIEGRTPGRPGSGIVIGVAVGLGCALLALGADLAESLESSRHSVAPFLVALPLALLPVPFLIAVVLLLDRLEPEPRGNLVFAFAWGAGIAALLAAVINTAGLVFITQPDLGKTTGEYASATFGARWWRSHSRAACCCGCCGGGGRNSTGPPTASSTPPWSASASP